MAVHIQMQTSVGGIIADRRLCLTSDRSRVVEADDPRAGFLLAPPGTEIPAADVARYGLTLADGKVRLYAAPAAAEPPPPEAPTALKKKGKAI